MSRSPNSCDIRKIELRIEKALEPANLTELEAGLREVVTTGSTPTNWDKLELYLGPLWELVSAVGYGRWDDEITSDVYMRLFLGLAVHVNPEFALDPSDPPPEDITGLGQMGTDLCKFVQAVARKTIGTLRRSERRKPSVLRPRPAPGQEIRRFPFVESLLDLEDGRDQGSPENLAMANEHVTVAFRILATQPPETKFVVVLRNAERFAGLAKPDAVPTTFELLMKKGMVWETVIETAEQLGLPGVVQRARHAHQSGRSCVSTRAVLAALLDESESTVARRETAVRAAVMEVLFGRLSGTG